jgi:hypothetical protein
MSKTDNTTSLVIAGKVAISCHFLMYGKKYFYINRSKYKKPHMLFAMLLKQVAGD